MYKFFLWIIRISFFLQIENIFGTIVIYNIFEEMDMRKISVTMLFVLALALLVGCTNAATGGTGSGSGSETENDYLAPLLGTWKTERYDEGIFVGTGQDYNVRTLYKFTKEKIVVTMYMKTDENNMETDENNPLTYEMTIQSVDEKNIYTINSDGVGEEFAYRLDNTNGKKLLYFGLSKAPLYWSN